jgi:hypothetical protein
MEAAQNLEALVKQLALLIDLPLDRDLQPGVVEQFRQIAAIAQLVMEFPLPEEIEPASVFEP